MEEALWFALGFGVLALLWKMGTDARTAAGDAARAACADAGVQWLDGAVVLQTWRFARGDDGRLCLHRRYAFDYSDDGLARRQGFVILRGVDVELVGLGPTLVRPTVH